MADLTEYKWDGNVEKIDSQMPDFNQTRFLPFERNIEYRFYRIKEISENKQGQYRMAMANVIASLNDNRGAIVYLLSGSPSGVDLYIGVAGTEQSISDDGEMLRHSFEGNFLGAKLEAVYSDDPALTGLFNKTKYVGLVSGVPSFNEEESNLDGEDFQGIERLVNTLTDERWQMVIVAEAGSDAAVREALDRVYELSTKLSSQVKHSVQNSENNAWNKSETVGTSLTDTKGSNRSEQKGTNQSQSEGNSQGSSWKGVSSGSSKNEGSNVGTTKGVSDSISIGTSDSTARGRNNSKTQGESGGESVAVTRERIDQRSEQLQKHLNETQIQRFLQGRSKGMYRTAIYICAENRNAYNRLARSVLSIFQGSKPSYTPLSVHHLPVSGTVCLSELLQLRRVSDSALLDEGNQTVVVHSIPRVSKQYIEAATWLTTQELSLLAGLPGLELPGLKLRKSVSFAVNTVDADYNKPLVDLGCVIQDGRTLHGKAVTLPHDALNRHVFVTGVTGAGKTTTCMKLLLETGFPFTVIEPAKTEYRALHGQIDNAEIEYYSLGREDLSTFRLNPFELVSPQQNLAGHISMLKATMCAVFPMEASMPFIVEQAIIQAYLDKGWDIGSNTNYLYDNPFEDKESDVWPTFSDMIAKLDGVIKSAGMGKEFEEKYRGSLVSRLTSLTDGVKGTMIDTPRSIDFDSLLDKKVVIELEELKDEEDKAFFMGLIIGRFAECMKQRHRKQPAFKHITLVEEAHRLLSRPEPGEDGSKKLGVEMFANMLAEVRKYGECLIIADQIPNKLVSDVIKNTNTKIIHRLFAADDRNTIGDAMGLNDEQKDFLPMLQAGETVIYSGGWHAAVRAQIKQLANTTAPEISEELIAEQGRKQLWKQREILFPRFSRSPRLNEDNFADVFHSAREQLNLLIALMRRVVVKDDKKTAPVIKADAARVRLRLRTALQNALNRFGMSDSEWAELVGSLFMDVKPSFFTLMGEYDNFMKDFKAIFIRLQGENLHELFYSHMEAAEVFLMEDLFKKSHSV